MIRGFLPSLSERRLLPETSVRGPMPAVIAIMTFATLVIAAAGLSLANAADLVATAARDRLVVQIPDGRDNRPQRVVEALVQMPGIVAADAVPEEEMRALLERWLGPAARTSELPIPSLIRLQTGAGFDRAALEARLGQVAPNARLATEQATIGPLLRSLRALQWLALSLVMLMSLAAASAVVLAARGALDTHRSTVEIMHGIGATDEQIARLFQYRIAQSSLLGSLGGSLLALLVLAALLIAGDGVAGDLAGRAILTGGDLAWLVAIPFFAVAIATVVARLAALGALRRSP